MLAFKFAHIFTHCERAFLSIHRLLIAMRDHRLAHRERRRLAR